jgi:hypothetical protein
MPLLPTLLAPRQLEAARPDGTRQRGYPGGLTRCYRDAISEADQDGQSTAVWQSSSFDRG